jgi:shikimate dehydrogenase
MSATGHRHGRTVRTPLGRRWRAGSVTGRPELSAHTKVVGVIGDPVAHSLSPTLHNAAFEAVGLDWVYVAFPVPRGRGAAAVAAVSALGLVGLNVTMPHKEDVAAACDELTPDASALRSVNTVAASPGGRTLGDSTDGPGFLDAIAADGIEVCGQPVLVLGAGGAARAVVLALGRAGATVTVAARRPEAAEAASALAPGGAAVPLGALAAGAPSARTGTASSVHPIDPAAFAVIVNATPLGMSGGDPLPVDPEALHGQQAVVDLVYHPADTPLLTAARAQGAQAVNGLGMLLHQAARSFTLWTGQPAPIDAMRAAVTAALAER